jgi:hypothetical protein
MKAEVRSIEETSQKLLSALWAKPKSPAVAQAYRKLRKALRYPLSHDVAAAAAALCHTLRGKPKDMVVSAACVAVRRALKAKPASNPGATATDQPENQVAGTPASPTDARVYVSGNDYWVYGYVAADLYLHFSELTGWSCSSAVPESDIGREITLMPDAACDAWLKANTDKLAAAAELVRKRPDGSAMLPLPAALAPATAVPPRVYEYVGRHDHEYYVYGRTGTPEVWRIYDGVWRCRGQDRLCAEAQLLNIVRLPDEEAKLWLASLAAGASKPIAVYRLKHPRPSYYVYGRRDRPEMWTYRDGKLELSVFLPVAAGELRACEQVPYGEAMSWLADHPLPETPRVYTMTGNGVSNMYAVYGRSGRTEYWHGHKLMTYAAMDALPALLDVDYAKMELSLANTWLDRHDPELARQPVRGYLIDNDEYVYIYGRGEAPETWQRISPDYPYRYLCSPADELALTEEAHALSADALQCFIAVYARPAHIRPSIAPVADHGQDEAWCHAACLTIAETGQKWGDAVTPSLAMKKVYELYHAKAALERELDVKRGKLNAFAGLAARMAALVAGSDKAEPSAKPACSCCG